MARLAALGGRFPITEDAPTFVTGFLTIDALLARDLNAFWVACQHLIMPAVAMSLSPLATIMRMMRASTLEVLTRDYVMTERALGLPERLIILKYVARNAFSATLTVIGLYFGWLLGGTVLVETVFDWPGLGLLRHQGRGDAGFHAGHRRDAGHRRALRGRQSRRRRAAGAGEPEGPPVVSAGTLAPPESARSIAFRRACYRFGQSWLSLFGLVLVVLLLFVALFGAALAPYPEHIAGGLNTAAKFRPPSLAHPFGTNELGQDVLSLVLWAPASRCSPVSPSWRSAPRPGS